MSTPTGFLTDRLNQLPKGFIIFIAVLLILLGLACTGAGATSLLVGCQWGKERGNAQSEPFIGGGLGGIAFGSLTFAVLAILLTLFVISKKVDPSLSSTGMIMIVLCAGVIGGVFGGKWRWAARLCCGGLGGFSISLLLIASFHPSSLLLRTISAALLAMSNLLLCLIPQTSKALTINSAFSGAWVFSLGLDLLLKFGLVDLPGLVVAKNGVSQSGKVEEMFLKWDQGRWKGLVAGWWLMGMIGTAGQWYWGGENGVEEVWDAYLSTLVSTGEASKASIGNYTPPPTFASRFLPTNWPWLNSSTTVSQSARFTNLPRKRGFKQEVERRRNPWDQDQERDIDDVTLNSTIWNPEDEEIEEEDDEYMEKLIGFKNAASKANKQREGPQENRGDGGGKKKHDLNNYNLKRLSNNNTKIPTSARYDALSEDELELEVEHYENRVDKGKHRSSLESSIESPVYFVTESALSRVRSAESNISGPTLVNSRHHYDPESNQGDSPTSTRPPTSWSDYEMRPNARPTRFRRPTEDDQQVTIPSTPSLIKAQNRIRQAQEQAQARSAGNWQQTTSRPSSVKSTSSRTSYDAWWATVIKKADGK